MELLLDKFIYIYSWLSLFCDFDLINYRIEINLGNSLYPWRYIDCNNWTNPANDSSIDSSANKVIS